MVLEVRPGQPEAAQLAAREAILSLGLFLPAAAVEKMAMVATAEEEAGCMA